MEFCHNTFSSYNSNLIILGIMLKLVWQQRIPTRFLNSLSCNSYDKIIKVNTCVKNALNNKTLPIVALESTIITHGMPYPKNIQ